MKIIINKLFIQNFKVFENILIDFESQNLIVFDGPNGFGKTTIYDAIELLITGQIRRYADLGKKIVDGREKLEQNPFYNINANGGDIIIRADILFGDDRKIIERRLKGGDDITKSYSFGEYKLFEKKDFSNTPGIEIKEESDFFEKLLGEYYKVNFEFLNYIEQEEGIRLLKSKEKDKKNSISHLFNTEEFEYKIEQLNILRNKILKLCDKSATDNLNTEKEKLDNLEKTLQLKSEVEYSELFSDKKNYWDEENIDFNKVKYSDLLGENGVVYNFNKLIQERQNYLNYNWNNKIEKLISKKNKIENVLRFSYFLEQKDAIRAEGILQDSINKTIKILQEFNTENLKLNNATIPSPIIECKDIEQGNIKVYNNKLKDLTIEFSQLSQLSSIHTQLLSTRNSLENKFIEFQSHNKDNTCICPFCGQDWKESSLLLDNIKSQGEKLKILLDESSGTFDNNLNEFKKSQIVSTIRDLKDYIIKSNYNKEFSIKLLEQNNAEINRLKNEISNLEVDINAYILKVNNLDEKIQIDGLFEVITNKKKQCEEGKIRDFFDDYYAKYFDSNEKILLNFDENSVKTKISYIDWKYSIFQNESITLKRIEVKDIERRYNLAKKKEGEIKSLIKIYDSSLKEYNQKIINDIEILFHIYSGRIVQDFQGGVGLFIDNSKGIKFLTDPENTHDAVFTMSSGQLAALMISFTLALNKKYSTNNLLLIDDPVQTMDEINLAGFIDILRNEFASHQIFISTHEEMISSYMRYKFDMAKLEQQRVNVKELNKIVNG